MWKRNTKLPRAFVPLTESPRRGSAFFTCVQMSFSFRAHARSVCAAKPEQRRRWWWRPAGGSAANNNCPRSSSISAGGPPPLCVVASSAGDAHHGCSASKGHLSNSAGLLAALILACITRGRPYGGRNTVVGRSRVAYILVARRAPAASLFLRTCTHG